MRRNPEAGYNMVMLIVAITLLNIMVAAMMPLMSTEIQREKEEELVFRGFQYAEAIRLFHKRFQRYPNKLSELLEMKPRSIRQLWKDPMTKDGKWGVIFQNQPVPIPVQPPGKPGLQPQPVAEAPEDGNGQDGGTGGLNTPKPGDVVAVGPIVGVYSKSPKTAHLIFYGHERYDEWRFTEDLLRVVAQRSSIAPGIGNPGQVAVPSFSTRWLGRPMQFVDQAQPQNGTLPDGTSPDPNNPTGPGSGPRPRSGPGKRPSP